MMSGAVGMQIASVLAFPAAGQLGSGSILVCHRLTGGGAEALGWVSLRSTHPTRFASLEV
jgi:hypothetical protein